MSIAVMPESRQPRSSRRSTIGSTLGCSGIAWNAGSFASRLYMRRVACPSAAVPLRLARRSSRSSRRIVSRSVDDQLGLDRVLDDRVAVGVDAGEVLGNRGLGERHHDTIADVEPLDNPVWHALTGPQAAFSEGSSLALRYQPDVAAVRRAPRRGRRPTPGTRSRDLVGPGGAAVLFRPDRGRRCPPTGRSRCRMTTLQMVATEPIGEPDDAFVDASAPPMSPRCSRSSSAPGPDRSSQRTVELGTYLGLRDESGDGSSR